MKTKEERKILIESVKPNVMELSVDPQGTHVVEKVLMCFDEESILDIYNLIMDNFVSLANNSNGLCVVKRVLICARINETISRLQNILVDNVQALMQNSFGNYAIQVALESWDQTNLEPVYKIFHNNFYSFSLHKYSSNVVEKCLEKGGEQILNKFVDEICQKSKVVGKT
jgi:pumilio RNA-binding family